MPYWDGQYIATNTALPLSGCGRRILSAHIIMMMLCALAHNDTDALVLVSALFALSLAGLSCVRDDQFGQSIWIWTAH